MKGLGFTDETIEKMKGPSLSFDKYKDSHYNGASNNININHEQLRFSNKYNGQNFTKKGVYDHEVGHYIQGQLAQIKPKFAEDVIKAQNRNKYLDELKKQPEFGFDDHFEIDYYKHNSPQPKYIESTEIDEISKLLSPKQNLGNFADDSHDYFKYRA